MEVLTTAKVKKSKTKAVNNPEEAKEKAGKSESSSGSDQHQLIFKPNPKVLNKKMTSIYLEPIEEEDRGSPKLRMPQTDQKLVTKRN